MFPTLYSIFIAHFHKFNFILCPPPPSWGQTSVWSERWEIFIFASCCGGRSSQKIVSLSQDILLDQTALYFRCCCFIFSTRARMCNLVTTTLSGFRLLFIPWGLSFRWKDAHVQRKQKIVVVWRRGRAAAIFSGHKYNILQNNSRK